MRKLTNGELAKRNALKVARTAIRLKHSIEADNEMNEFLPALEEQIDSAITGGKRLEISAGRLFEAAFEGESVDNS